ncbi:MAG TPA: ThiF family adenylyltransferase, partial [Desulfobaccales bacterium]|nr:ThiF family adenylyltransferase [Desulfobaccales bacterium]
MESLKAVATRITRAGQEGLMVSGAALVDWAERRQVDLHQACEAALAAGLFPECWERNFPSLTAAEQLRLFRSSVLVAGLGGLGGFLCELLARLGVGRLLLADGDHFTPGNLNRQLLATRNTLGQNKAVVAARRLHEINPAIIAEALPDFLTPENLPGYLSQVRVAMDGLDNIPSRRTLAAAAHEAGIPLVHGAVTGKFGQVSTLMPAEAGDPALLHPTLMRDAPAAREVLAPTVALVASLQVQETLRLLLGRPPAYKNHLAHFDGDTGQ